MKELKLEELSIRQKLGMTFTAFINGSSRTPEEDAFILDLIKNHSLGCVWVQVDRDGVEELIAKVKEVADYPILIMTDAENGIEPYVIGEHNAVACTGNIKHAYIFGKTLAVNARKLGYNVVCNPVVDMRRGSQRSLGTDKEKVGELASAIAQGMHDGGILTVAKHYPSSVKTNGVDSHMAENFSYDTKEELLAEALYPYKRLMEKDLLDGIMTGHTKLPNIDSNRPASLSKPVIDVIREIGFDGFAITDALSMVGIRANYNDVEAKGFAIAAGNDTILPWGGSNRQLFDEFCQAYDQGLISDERLDEAARRMLDAQHKSTVLPKDAELSAEDIAMFESINKDSVCAKTDEGVSTGIDPNGNHYFAVMIRSDYGMDADGKVDVDTFSSDAWRKPLDLKAKILKKFPNSQVSFVNEFPAPFQNYTILNNSKNCDEVIFLTFSEFVAYTGAEKLTHRFVKLIEAMQLTDRVTTILHQGNPVVLEDLPHVPRWILGNMSPASFDACLDVLAGEYPAKGVTCYDFELK
ncbi:MAG: glycoside hydrolase family 3 N-terminal domain-containing protein [Clostridia bacterium]|nr:glycoside hydrolase family 3 N-terminal domain-containing protein [Clostridia bacterium]